MRKGLGKKVGADFHPLLIIILCNITQVFHTHTRDYPRYLLPDYMQSQECEGYHLQE